MTVMQFGAPVSRLEDPQLLRGEGRYLDDIHLPDMLHAVFVRSQQANAEIRGIDISQAIAVPGVHAIFTAKDLPDAVRTRRMPQPVPAARFAKRGAAAIVRAVRASLGRRRPAPPVTGEGASAFPGSYRCS